MPPDEEGELVEEEVEVVRPREGETDPAELIERIEADLGTGEE
jgi:hypothetical protein